MARHWSSIRPEPHSAATYLSVHTHRVPHLAPVPAIRACNSQRSLSPRPASTAQLLLAASVSRTDSSYADTVHVDSVMSRMSCSRSAGTRRGKELKLKQQLLACSLLHPMLPAAEPYRSGTGHLSLSSLSPCSPCLSWAMLVSPAGPQLNLVRQTCPQQHHGRAVVETKRTASGPSPTDPDHARQGGSVIASIFVCLAMAGRCKGSGRSD
jgi:hypothetical protein